MIETERNTGSFQTNRSPSRTSSNSDCNDRPLGIAVDVGGFGVEAAPDRRERERGHDERARVDEQEVGHGHERHECSGQYRAEHLTGRIRRHHPPVRGDQLVARDEARDRGELPRLEKDPERCLYERNRVDPPDPKRAREIQDRQHRDHRAPRQIDQDHHALAVHAVDDRAEHEPEEQVRHEVRGHREREVRGRVRQPEDQQREREGGEGAPELRDALPREVDPEVATEAAAAAASASSEAHAQGATAYAFFKSSITLVHCCGSALYGA